VLNYDQNNNLLSLTKAHSVGNENHPHWDVPFTLASKIPGFDRPGRTCLVDMEKSIGASYKGCMENATLFLDERHVVKNMSGGLGNERAVGPGLYSRALRAPSKALVDAVVAQFGPRQATYLSKYNKEELYKAYSNLKDSIVTSQGAESAMHAALKNNVRNVEPMKMLETIVNKGHEKFMQLKAQADAWQGPVPPRTEKRLADSITRAKRYTVVTPVPGTNQMSWNVQSLVNPTHVRRVDFSEVEQTPLCAARTR
jgi:hypothetical protein